MNEQAAARVNDLKQVWVDFRRQNPKMRIRDAAEELGVSEAELLATSCGETVTRLAGDWGEVIRALPVLGPVMALTRNDHAVHEKRGAYRKVQIDGDVGLVLDEAIDLRIFLDHWHLGFAVEEETADGVRRSLQFFDAHGTAVHKVYLESESDVATFEEIVERHRSLDQSQAQSILPLPPRVPELSDAMVDVSGLRAAWRALTDTHDFVRILERFAVGRRQALRLAGDDLARRVATGTLRRILEAAASAEVSIMVFVGNRGTIQIHSGPVRNLKALGPWFNVLDHEFNLHLREDRIDSAWVVRKPTSDGVVTSLELYDAGGDTIALLFGKRKPGVPESEAWRQTIERL